jgi:uridine kinase
VSGDSFWNGSQFELARLHDEVVAPLLNGANGRYREWDWDAGSLGRLRVVEPAGILVIEGVCALHRMFRDHENVRVWVDAPADVRLERGVARDGEAMRARWTGVWMPGEDAYVAADQPKQCAHIKIDGTRPL